MYCSQVGTAGSRKFAGNLGKTTQKLKKIIVWILGNLSNKMLAYSRTKGLKLLLSRKSGYPNRRPGDSFWYLGGYQIIWEPPRYLDTR